jgi:hypothetical protein
MPSRDDITKAWGDGLLASLKPTVKARFAAGRFLPNDDAGAVFAVPNEPHRLQCEPLKGEVEAVLAKRFGRPIKIRLVVDPGSEGPGERDSFRDPPASTSAPDDDSSSFSAEDFDALEDAPAQVASPEERLKQAFPGAEEVNP